ncbi:hypothetical protein [Frigidibacter sp. SD6-1]|uniref:hypothetical protein n=1 Tax=Frigidibacter sp. SD6-1 TaxID=3032581 RepID=UPI0024DFD2B4|nr:hypothetical protein [Frigidibacter sp. SD6-1]
MTHILAPARFAPLLLVPLLAACDDVGPVATKAATRLVRDASASGPGWAADIDRPLAEITLDGRARIGPVTHDDGPNGRTFRGQFDGQSYALLISAGPCVQGSEGAPTSFEFHARLTIGDRVLEGCANRGRLRR